MTESLHRRTLTFEHDKKYNYFWSYPQVKVCCCSNIYYVFGHVHHVNVGRWEGFSQIHIFSVVLIRIPWFSQVNISRIFYVFYYLIKWLAEMSTQQNDMTDWWFLSLIFYLGICYSTVTCKIFLNWPSIK